MSNPIVTIEMENGGVIRAELYPEVAPNTVRNFRVQLCTEAVSYTHLDVYKRKTLSRVRHNSAARFVSEL